MKRSFEEDVGEASARGTRQRRHDDGGWGILSFIKHVPLLNKFVATTGDDDNEIEDIPVEPVETPSPKRPTQQQAKSPIRRASAVTPTQENKRSFTFPRATGDDESKASASPAKPRFESNDDQVSNSFVFTRKSHSTTPNKQQKVVPSSVHDQTIDVSDFYTPGSFAPRPAAKTTDQTQPPAVDNTAVLPIQLFGDSSNSSRLSRGGLIKKITLSREERRQKRPVPSRLLANHSTNAREHSKVITERILATLSAMDADPLAKETQKPAPSLSMSWGKYHLDLVEQEKANASAGLDFPVQEGVPRPPVSSLSSQLPKTSSLAAAVAAPKEPSTKTTPAKRDAALFGFSTPAPVSGSVATDAETLLNKPVKYTFSKPQKVIPSKNATAVKPTKPYQFVSPPVQAPTIIRNASPPSSSTAAAIPPSNSSVNPLDKFKIRKPGSWTCSMCMVNNLDAKLTQCPSCETPKDASSSSPPPSAASSTNPLAKFMQHAPGSWACPSCKVRNDASKSKCPCCETAKPGDNDAPAEKASTSSPLFGFTTPASSSTSDKPAVTFGVSNADKPAAVKPTFSFGAPSLEPAAKVSFGVMAAQPAASDSKPADKPAATGGFSFGLPAAASTDAKPASGGFTISSDSKSDKPSTADKPVFSFGAPADKPTPATDKPAFALSAPADKPAPTSDKPAFVFGAPADKPATSTDKPAFAFGAAKAAPSTDAPAPSLGGSSTTFGFGKPEPAAASGDKPSFGAPAGGSGFSFGGSTAASSSETKAPAFTFGDASKPATAAKDAAPAFTLEPKSKKRSAESEQTGGPLKVGGDSNGGAGLGSTPATLGSSTTFGSATSLSTFGSAAADKPSFGGPAVATFGAPAATATFGAPSATTAFGASSDKPAFSASADKPTFGAAPAAAPAAAAPASSTFVFGNSAPAAPAAAAPASSTFLFGGSAPSSSSSTTPPKAPFGAAFGAPSAAPATSFGFGSTSTGGFGASTAASAAPAAAAPSFGATTFGTPATSSASFGQSPPTSSSGFGSTFNFGSTAPPATTGAFGAAAPAAPSAFGGSAPTSSSSFGGSFGAPAAPSAFGAPAPAATAFGAPAAAGFGAPAFGAAQPTSAFGGAPAAAASSGFGASAGFGGFGQAAPITAAAGSFSMGVAEPKKAPNGRRIVKAKAGGRRQSQNP